MLAVGWAWSTQRVGERVSAAGELYQAACQNYRTTSGAGSVVYRTCPDESCAAIGGASSQDLICVLGVADENTSWLEVNPDPDNANAEMVYVRGDEVEPGFPDERNEYVYCNAHSPYTGEVVVRAEPEPDAPALGEITEEDTVCVTQYATGFIYWLGLENGGFADISAFEPIREEFRCDNGWQVVWSSVDVHSCAGFQCNVVSTLPQGTQVCVTSEEGETIDWVGYRYADTGRTGWSYLPLLEPLPEPDDAFEDEDVVQPTVEPTIPPYAVTVADINMRAASDFEAAVVSGISDQTRLNVLGVAENGWYYVQTRAGAQGWVSPESVTLRGNRRTVPRALVGENESIITEVVQLPTSTPTTPPTATPTLEAITDLSSQMCSFARVDVSSANVREEPSTTSQVVGRVDFDDLVCVLQGVEQPDAWTQIRFLDLGGDLVEGYIAADLILALVEQPTDAPTVIAQQPIVVTREATAPPDETDEPDTPTDVPTVQPELPTPALDTIAEGEAIDGTPTLAPFLSSSGAVTLTPTPGVCQPGQAADNCVTPTPAGIAFFAPPTPQVSGVLLAQDVPLGRFNFRTVELESPQGNASFVFRLPDDWVMDGQNVALLQITYTEESQQPAEGSGSGADQIELTSQLNILLDGQLVSSLTLRPQNAGEPQVIEVLLPNSLLNRQQFHRLELDFRAQDFCEALLESSVLINADRSQIHYEYQEELPLLDLSQYPRPFYNNRPPTENESVVIVLPPEPSDTDLNAAAAISGGLGFLTDNGIVVRVRSADGIAEVERDNNNLILVGAPDANPLIADYYEANSLPTSYDGANITVDGVTFEPTDGIIQLTYNRANPDYATMVVTGLTDEAIEKAAQALAGPPGDLSLGGPLIAVTGTQPIVRADLTNIASEELTLRDLGQEEDVVLRGLGESRYDLEFSIPPGTELSTDAYVDVLFNYSRLLENPNSSFTVLINEVPIGSIVLDGLESDADVSAANAQGVRRFRAPISPSLVRPGAENFLTFIVSAVTPNFECTTPDGDVVWFTISDQSTLNLSRQTARLGAEADYVGLFPAPFNQLPNLGDLWINLPEDATDFEMEQAMRLVAQISGVQANAEGINPRITRGALPEDADLSGYNFILIGRPTNNPVIAQLNEMQDDEGNSRLPQPFEPGTDIIEQRLDDITYRLFPGFEVGVIQKLSSPWSQSDVRKVLVITGTSQASVREALTVLVEEEFTGAELAGNVVFVGGGNVSYVDTTNLIRDPEAVLNAALELPTEQFISALTATATAQGTAPFTVTPLPEGVVSSTPDPLSTPMAAGAIITATSDATATPTIEPVIDPENPDLTVLEGVATEQPQFVRVLLIATGVMVVVAALYGLFRMVMRYRRRMAKQSSS